MSRGWEARAWVDNPNKVVIALPLLSIRRWEETRWLYICALCSLTVGRGSVDEGIELVGQRDKLVYFNDRNVAVNLFSRCSMTEKRCFWRGVATIWLLMEVFGEIRTLYRVSRLFSLNTSGFWRYGNVLLTKVYTEEEISTVWQCKILQNLDFS